MCRGMAARSSRRTRRLPETLSRRIRLQARRLGVSAATVFHAVWAVVLAHTSAREDVVFGSVLLGRLQSSAGAQRILGMFINTLPLRLRLQQVGARESGGADAAGADRAVGARAGLVGRGAALQWDGRLEHAVQHAVELSAQHTGTAGDGGRMRAGVRVLASRGGTNYPVVLSVDDAGEGFGLEMETDRRIDPKRMLGFVCTALQSLVQALEEAPQTAALSLSILPETERHQVLKLFNATQMAYPQGKLLHELFEEQVRRTPGAVAVRYEDQSLSYAELNTKSNQLAWYLRKKGIGPDQLVGICVERSLEMVIGLLGILKAGGAYVPLDPNYPPERLAYLLQDAAPSCAAHSGAAQGDFPGERATSDGSRRARG